MKNRVKSVEENIMVFRLYKIFVRSCSTLTHQSQAATDS